MFVTSFLSPETSYNSFLKKMNFLVTWNKSTLVFYSWCFGLENRSSYADSFSCPILVLRPVGQERNFRAIAFLEWKELSTFLPAIFSALKVAKRKHLRGRKVIKILMKGNTWTKLSHFWCFHNVWSFFHNIFIFLSLKKLLIFNICLFEKKKKKYKSVRRWIFSEKSWKFSFLINFISCNLRRV